MSSINNCVACVSAKKLNKDNWCSYHYKELRATGICIQCATNKTTDGHIKCYNCFQANITQMRSAGKCLKCKSICENLAFPFCNKCHKISTDARISSGVCIKCNKTRENVKFPYCNKCHQEKQVIPQQVKIQEVVSIKEEKKCELNFPKLVARRTAVPIQKKILYSAVATGTKPIPSEIIIPVVVSPVSSIWDEFESSSSFSWADEVEADDLRQTHIKMNC